MAFCDGGEEEGSSMEMVRNECILNVAFLCYFAGAQCAMRIVQCTLCTAHPLWISPADREMDEI